MNSKRARLTNTAVEEAMDVQILREDVERAMHELKHSVDRMIFAAVRVCGALEGLETEPPRKAA